MDATRTAVVAEDDPPTRAFVARVLGMDGYAVREARDGLEAFAWARADPPDLLVADDLMPGMGGEELAVRLRGAGVAVPMVLISETHDTLDIPGVACIRKPFRREDLLAKVAEALAEAEGLAGGASSA